MNCAAHPETEERGDVAPEIPVAQRRCLRRTPEPRKPAPTDWRLDEICERGAYFCPRCPQYQFSNPTCGRCGRAMIWNPPIFSDEQKTSPAEVQKAA